MYFVKAILATFIGALLLGPIGAVLGLILFVAYDAKKDKKTA